MTIEKLPEGTYMAALQSAVTQIEQEIGLEQGFLNSIYGGEDDWSFILKLHALLDSALTLSIGKAIGHRRLDPVIARLPLSGKAGKRAFALALHALSRQEDGLLDAIGRVRNRLAHDPTHAKFTLRTYLDGLSLEQRRQFSIEIAGTLMEGDKAPDALQRLEEVAKTVVLQQPRFSIWIASMYLIARLYARRLQADSIQRAIMGLDTAIAGMSEWRASSSDQT
jgi:hypothetical protein